MKRKTVLVCSVVTTALAMVRLFFCASAAAAVTLHSPEHEPNNTREQPIR